MDRGDWSGHARPSAGHTEAQFAVPRAGRRSITLAVVR